MSAVGARLPRTEDPRLLRGRGRFGDDISVPGQLWARLVRSPSAHGQVSDLDITQAAKAPGIAAVVTAADLPPGLVIPVRLTVPGPDLSGYLQPMLAMTVVMAVLPKGQGSAQSRRARKWRAEQHTRVRRFAGEPRRHAG